MIRTARSLSIFLATSLVSLACGEDKVRGVSPKLTITVELAKEQTGMVDFDDVVVPNKATRTLKLTNDGKRSLNLTNIKLAGDSSFTTSNLPGSIAEGQTQQVVATFAPKGLGKFEASLSFETDDPERKSVSIKMIGTGSDPQLIVCAPPLDVISDNCDGSREIDFGQSIEKFTKRRAIRLIANSGSDVVINSVTMHGNEQGAFKFVEEIEPGTHVPADGDLWVQVDFTGMEPDNYAAQVQIESNDPDLPNAKLTLKGEAVLDCRSFSETFTQAALPKNDIDILFIIDDSGSMATAQNEVKTKITSFITELNKEKMDFRIAVTTTNMMASLSNHAPGDIIMATYNSQDFNFVVPGAEAVTKFTLLMDQIDTDGSGDELGFLAAETALTTWGGVMRHNDVISGTTGWDGKGKRNDAWYRKDARLAVIWVSDEEESGSPTTVDRTTASDYAQNFFLKIKQTPDQQLRFVAIVDPGESAQVCNNGEPLDTAATNGTPRYHEFIEEVGPKIGRLISFCSDFEDSLKVAGDFIAEPQCQFALGQGVLTKEESNEVCIVGGQCFGPSEWEYVPGDLQNPNGYVKISVGCPEQQSQIVVDYTSCLRSYDDDADKLSNLQDNCPNVANEDQNDSNANGVGDICE